MKINKSVLFPLFICVIIWNVFLLTSNRFSGDKKIEKETRGIYRILENEVNRMNGIITGRRGRVTDLFAIDIDFNKSDNYDREFIFSNFKKLGFKVKAKSNIYNSFVFCRGKSGFLVSGDKKLTIDYRYRMSYCFE